MKIIAAIQARFTSKRLPGKVMLELENKPVIWHIYQRLKSTPSIDNVVLSIGDADENQIIKTFAQNEKIPIYQGSEVDVIERLYKTTEIFGGDLMIRITADCPLVDPKIVENMIQFYKKDPKKFDIITNCKKPTFPHGFDVEIYSKKILKEMNQNINDKRLREWFPVYIDKNLEKFKIHHFTNDKNLSSYRLTIDYPEDYKLIKKIFAEFYSKNKNFGMEDIICFLRNKPELLEINSKYQHYRNLDAPI